MMKSFDNTRPNIILLADRTDVITMPKTLGPYKIAHVLRSAGFEVAVINHLSVFFIDELMHLLSQMISDKTLFVGISNFYYASVKNLRQHDDGAVELLECEPGSFLPHGREFNQPLKNLVRSHNANCKLVLGGPTAVDAETNRDFDYIVVGYAEISAVNLAHHLCDPTVPLAKSRRSIWGPTVVDDSRADGYDFATCSMRYEDHDVILPGELLTMEVARGCIFRCAFCSYPMNGKKKLDFIRNKDLIIAEMEDNFARFGITRYNFCDDTVNDSVEKCQMIWEISQNLSFDLEWWGYIRLDLLTAHPETTDLLFGSGLKGVLFGIETLHPQAAKIIGKGGDRERLFATVRKIKDRWGNAVNLYGTFIYGLPLEDLDSLRRTTEFLLSDANPLDSWAVQALNIKPVDYDRTHGFLSDIDINYEKYGYQNLGTKPASNSIYHSNRQKDQMLWKNQYTDFESMEQWVKEIRDAGHRMGRNRISGFAAFGISGLGVPLHSVLNKPLSEIDWNTLDRMKLQRALEYKHRLFEHLGADPTCIRKPVHHETFTQYLSDINQDLMHRLQ